MRASRVLQLIGTLAMCILPAACSRQSAQPIPDAATLLQTIPAADPTKYADLSGKKAWQNPYLIVRADNVGLLSGVSASEERLLKPEEVLDALAHLPASAWPFGRVAAIVVRHGPNEGE